MYTVIEHESVLEIHDVKGKNATHHKRQRVKFEQNSILAFQDKAQGDGDIFADYQCSPGVAVDRYKQGPYYHVLISLREVKRRGDIEEFRIQRTIKDGFTQDSEYFQSEIVHPTEQLSLAVIFPSKRPIRRITLVEKNIRRTTDLGPEHQTILPDGRIQYQWITDKPRIYESYLLKWDW